MCPHLLSFFDMNPERNGFDAFRKEVTPHKTLVEASCAPLFQRIRADLGIDLTSEKIISFAKRNGIEEHAVQLATHVCEILLSSIRDEQNGNAYIHTTKHIREMIRRLAKSHNEKSRKLVLLYTDNHLPLVTNTKMFDLAKLFIEEL